MREIGENEDLGIRIRRLETKGLSAARGNVGGVRGDVRDAVLGVGEIRARRGRLIDEFDKTVGGVGSRVKVEVVEEGVCAALKKVLDEDIVLSRVFSVGGGR